MSEIIIKNLNKNYGKNHVIQDISLDIESQSFTVLVGPSGCGKSTILRMIAGLENINSGTISIDGNIVNDLSPKDRNIAMVFQSYALYPHMTVFDNMAFALKQSKTPKDEIQKRVTEAAKVLQIETLFERLPKQLSGGQRQRVAIGRAIVRDPKVFLFDEPLSNLDAALRVQTRIEIAKLHSQLTATMIYVTHDQVEAMTLADRIVVLNNGVIEQVGTPIELYNSPKNQFVAEFIGSPKMNIIDLEGEQKSSLINIQAPNQSAKIGIRPEHFRVASNGSSKLQGKVRHIENLGEHLLCYIKLGKDYEITAKLDVGSEINVDEIIQLDWQKSHEHFFNSSGISID